ncbi:hypothetical protein PCASD_02084 [Puccinia coronata f. sp. avenae]|uniref:Uncharacterized protein n=1 Tax=Puccinia coronata f. sp. avenae TaxID=200324 RepID=A0A2N5VQ23_9BASI|nr:hypothetical protein PCASD_02084 [Puccinia coronata f. sp. avenae]
MRPPDQDLPPNPRVAQLKGCIAPVRLQLLSLSSNSIANTGFVFSRHKRIRFPFKARSLPSSLPKTVLAIMGFVKYDRDLKVIAVKLQMFVVLARWKRLYCHTRDVVRDPAFYADQGCPSAFSAEESDFVLATLDAEPALYLDEIQSHIEAMTGTRHPLSTISDHLKFRLNLTKKRAEFINCIGPYPTNYYVFTDECAVSLRTHSRDRAWAKCGRRTARLPRPLRKSNRISVLLAVSLDGLMQVMAQPGSIRKMDMEYFLEFVLYSGDGQRPEKVFSVLKSRLKREMLLTGTDEDPDIIKDFLPEFVNKDLMAALFRGSGY